MSNAARLFKMAMAPGPALGTAIAAINIYNHRRSPIYRADGSNDLRIALGIGLKAVVYSTFWPFATYGIASDIYGNKKQYERHFVPFSVHGKD